MKVLRILSLVTLPTAGSFAQNAGIITDGSVQKASVILDMLKIIPEVVGGKETETTKGETPGLSYGNLAAELKKTTQGRQSITKVEQKQIKELTIPVNQLVCKN